MRRPKVAIGVLLATALTLAPGSTGAEGASGGSLALVEEAALAADAPANAPHDALDPMALLGAVESAIARGDDAGAPLCVVGVCGGTVRDEVRAAARDVLTLVAESMRTIDRGATPDDADERAERLAIARESVLPLRAARAALWMAGTATPEQRLAWARRAEALAADADAVTAWAMGERGLILGLARAIAGEGDEALASFAEAREAWSADENAPPHGAALELNLGIALALATSQSENAGVEAARSQLERVATRTPFVTTQNQRDWALALLAASVSDRINFARAGNDPSERLRAVELAALRAPSLINARNTTEPDPGVRRRDVYERLRWLIDEARLPEASVVRLPGVGVAAVAAGAEIHDQAARRAAIDLLERALDADDADGARDDANVLYELGRVSAPGTAGERSRGAEALLRFADLAPTDDRTPTALALACAAASGLPGAEGEALYTRCLRAAIGTPGASSVPRIDTWRLELARVLLSRDADAEISTRWGAMLEASEALRSVEGDERRDDAARTLVRTWLAAIDEVRPGAGAIDDTGHEWRERVAVAARAEGEHVVSALDGAGDASIASIRAGAHCLIAEAALELGDPKGAAEHAAKTAGADVGPEIRARAEATLFAASAALGHAPEAFAHLDTASALDQPRAINTLRRAEHRAWSAVELGTDAFPEPNPAPALAQAADILARAIAWRDAHDLRIDAPTRERAARALVHARRAEDALRVLGPADNAPVEMLLLRGEAQLLANQDAAAFDAFRRVAVALDPDRTSTRPYWHAWARMLEILQRRNPDGARSPDIRREIRRLRTLESWGRFDDCAERIEAVGRAVGP